jgi:hypothetical protein
VQHPELVEIRAIEPDRVRISLSEKPKPAPEAAGPPGAGAE